MASVPNLPTLVGNKFKEAQKTGDLTFYETQISIVHCDGVPFQVRFSPALANKPRASKPRDPNKKPFDPFENPPKGLLIAELPSHNLVLNKFPVIPDHFILATKAFKEQTDLLEEEDLGAAYACLQSYRDNDAELFGFYNSGEHSGASQRRRHIQFLPVKSMRAGMKEGDEWEVLADSLLNNPRLPFIYYSSPIPEAPSSQILHQIYTVLHKTACIESKYPISPTGSEAPSPISYNLGLTDYSMALCPRTSEGTNIKSSTGELVGPVSLNGTVLGGTLLVKSEEEWEALKGNESKLKEVLSIIGISPTKVEHDEKL